jgi:hypothetical protein
MSGRNSFSRVAYLFVKQNLFSINFKLSKDEKTCQSYPNGSVYMWRYDGERYDPNLVEEKSTSGRFSCNFHWFMSRRGLEELTLIDGHLNSEKYCEILENTVFPAMDYFQENFIPFFMHDRYKLGENID